MKSLIVVTTLILCTTTCSTGTHQSAANSNLNKSQNASPDKTRAGWQTALWEKQGITFTLPPDWRKDDLFPDTEEKTGAFLTSSSIGWKGPLRQSLEVSVETGAEDFPVTTEAMLEKDYEIDQRLKREGKIPVEDLRYLELDGVKGEYFRDLSGGDERVKLSWITYRHYRGKAQHLFIRLFGSQKELETLVNILNSTKVARD